MAAKGGIENNIEPGLIARAVAGIRYAFTGRADWFGPGVPQTPTAPDAIEGRQFQFPISTNTVISTKTEGVNFHTLRHFADGCDIVRLLIETRKDQVCGFAWSVKPIDGDKKKPSKDAKPDPRVAEVTAFLKRPDKEHSFSEWLRLLLEDMFVLDAPTLYIQRTRGKSVYALRPIDGGTIKRIIDTHGWTPMPPLPAYQQILQGTVALSYDRDEMLYKPRNPRTNKIYGYGPVEQTIVTAKLLLSRQASNLEYYDNGNLPEGFLTAADGWTPEQLLQFQAILDSMLSGNLAERRKVRVIPAKSTYTAAKEPALKGDFDEWLARIACFAFNYPPTPFIKQMNRSTSDNAKEAADEEGVQPITRWVKELMDEIIQDRLGFADLEFNFEDKEAQDPLERAQIDQIYVNCGVLVPNEVRADLGLEPLPEPQQNEPDISTLEEPVADDGSASAPGNDKASTNGTGPAKAPPKATAKVPVKKADKTSASEKHVSEQVAAALELSAEEVAEAAGAAINDGATVEHVVALVDQLPLMGLAQATEVLAKAIEASATSGGEKGLLQLNLSVGLGMTEQVNQSAIAWAQRRAGELITRDGDGGELVDATRNLIRATIEQAVKEGWSTQRLCKALKTHYAFSPQRAMVIARTELAMAESTGNLQAFIASGVVQKKRWILDPDPCPTCIANAAQGGIPLLQAFQGGVMTAPQHPNCRCAIAPVID